MRDGEVGLVEVEPASGLTTTRLSRSLPPPRGADDAIEQVGELLAGRGLDSHRALVALNAAHLLLLSGIVTSLENGMSVGDDILRSGAALAGVHKLSTVERSA